MNDQQPIKVIQGKHGEIRIFKPVIPPSQNDLDQLYRFLVKAVIKKQRGAAT